MIGVLLLLAAETVSDPAAPAGPVPKPGIAAERVPLLPPPSLVREIRRATILRLTGKTAEGLLVLEKAAEDHPTEVAPLLALLTYGREADLGPEAAALARRRIAERLADPSATVDAATLFQALHGPHVPVEDLRTLRDAVAGRITIEPEDPEMMEMLAILETRLENLPAAREALARAATLRPSTAIEERLIALDTALGRWDEVVRRSRGRLERDPADSARRMDLARALARLGRETEAAEVVGPLLSDKVYRLIAASEIFVPLGWHHRDQGNDTEAERAFRKALELDPSEPVAKAAVTHYYSGTVDRLAARKSEDDRWMKEQNPYFLVREGASRLAAQDASGALPLLRRATEVAPDDAIAWYNRGLAAQRLEAWDEAGEAYRKTSEIAPQMAEGWLGLGRVEHRNRRFALAIEVLERAVAIRPDLQQAHALLAQCHEALGNADAAATHRRLSQGPAR